MKTLSDKFAEAYASWLCCLPCLDEQPLRSELPPPPLPPPPPLLPPPFYWDVRRAALPSRGPGLLTLAGDEKDIVVFRDQPGFTPPPSLEPWNQDARVYKKERAPRKSFGSLSRKSFSLRKSSRRPQISAPSDFRHVYSESFQFPPQEYSFAPRPRPASFRPLELSIYLPENDVSPIFPHFDYSHPNIPAPPPAHTHASSFDSDAVTLAHQRSYSSMSFHLPRRPLPDASPSMSFNDSPPRIPPRSRLRANTAPSVERIVERIASAMIERDRLQAEIESIMERQSIYVSSRPSTAYGLEGERAPSIGRDSLDRTQYSRPLPELEPLPAVPALPAAAPSFAERLSIDRPLTARSQSEESQREKERAALYAAPPRPVTPPRSSPRINGRVVDIPLAPPLPLVLRPPLRKKKSFSRVSNWLFPGDDGQHQRDISLDSITNQPRPVKGGEGFYQCVAPAQASGSGNRNSMDTVSTVSTWTTEEDRTMPTTWSPGSSPATKQETPSTSTIADRRGTFGGRPIQNGHRPQSVGVAF